MIQHRYRRSWSPAFTEYVSRQKFNKLHACVVCGKPVVGYTYFGELIHIKCFEKYRQP